MDRPTHNPKPAIVKTGDVVKKVSNLLISKIIFIPQRGSLQDQGSYIYLRKHYIGNQLDLVHKKGKLWLKLRTPINRKGKKMSYDFNADEVFEMAEQMERNGAQFYRDAAETAADSSNKDMLIGLSKMEEAHEKMFESMRADLTAAEKASTVFDPSGEASLYLRALVDSRVFFKKEIDVTSIVEILKSAIEAEKDSIVFYLGMKEAVAENLGKDRIDVIIKEEMGHIQVLSKELVAQTT